MVFRVREEDWKLHIRVNVLLSHATNLLVRLSDTTRYEGFGYAGYAIL